MSGTPRRVLVVEDDEILRDTLAEVMVDEGHDVRVAPNGLAALDVIGSWEPDVIILDLMMPLMDAYEFRLRQHSNQLAPRARVLVLSATRDLEGAASRVGAHAWLGKPFLLSDIIETVDRLLRDRVA